jgi:response regulator NasT
LQYAELLDEGILVCGYKLPDMLYTHLREYLPLEFEILLVASPDKWQEDIKGVVGLSAPLKVYDLMSTMEMMQQAMDRRRRIRKKEKRAKNPDQQKKIREAKELLMERNCMSEEEAHRYLQKCSMDSGTNLVETAEMVLSVMAE